MNKTYFREKSAMARLGRALLMVLLTVVLVTNTGSLATRVQAEGQALESTGSLIYLPQVYRGSIPVWMGPDGGSVVCLKAAPSNANVVYAGTLNNGVYRSDNRGVTWTLVNQGLGNMFIDSLAVDPSNSNTVYAGTHGAGVYKSVNAGASWAPVNSGIADRTIVYTLAVNPGNTNLVYAGTRIEGTYYNGVMYKSTNGGASWSRVMEFSEDWVYSIAVSPSEPNRVLAAVHTGGPVYSTDYGSKNTWASADPPDFDDDYLVERWMKGRAVAFDPRDWQNRAHYTSWHDGFLSYSTSNGERWSMSSGEAGTSHIYPNGISVKPNSPDIVYLAAHESNVAGVLRSDNAGSSYSGAGLRGKTVYTVAALGGGGDTVLAGTYLDGVYKSDNGGSSWYYSMSGISESNVTGMVFPGGETVFGSTRTGGGVFRSLDGGKTWMVFNANLGDIQINGLVLHPSNPNILFALTTNAGLRRIDLSTSGGWSPAGVIPLDDTAPVIESEGLFAPPEPPDDALAIDGETAMLPTATDELTGAEMMAVSAPVYSMAFAPSNSNIAYLGTNGAGVYLSTNGGTSWNPAGISGVLVRSLAVRPDNAAVVYAATNQNGQIKMSTNSGSSWQSVSLPDGGLSIFAVAALPSIPDAVFVGTSNGVYRYQGGSWTHEGLAGTAVQVLGYNRGAPGYLYAGTPRGAFRAPAGLPNFWSPLAGELGDKVVTSLNFNPAEPNTIYVGTEARGTLKITLP